MKIASTFILALTLLAALVSGSDSNDNAERVADSSGLSSSSSMLRKGDKLAQIAAETESYRNDSSTVLEETLPSDQDNRVLAKDCNSDERVFMIDITTDKNGFENEWTLKMRDGNRMTNIESGPGDVSSYGSNSRYIVAHCLKAGQYRFIIKDTSANGMCCDFGNGKYSGYVVDDSKVKVFSSPSDPREDWAKRVHSFTISKSNAAPQTSPKPTPKPTPKPRTKPTRAPTRKPTPLVQLPLGGRIARDNQWLVSHNTRRKEWHEKYDETYIPLKWSDALKKESEAFAKKLLEDSCGDLYHDKSNIHGENLASNYGSGNWAVVRSTDSIVTRWVEDEADVGWPGNGHLTAALWRATKYVGCGEASKPRNGGSGMCHTQVCRYAKPGNCNMNNYKTNKKDWWLMPMLMDDSPCGPSCPPDGCQ